MLKVKSNQSMGLWIMSPVVHILISIFGKSCLDLFSSLNEGFSFLLENVKNISMTFRLYRERGEYD